MRNNRKQEEETDQTFDSNFQNLTVVDAQF